jgi:hypothetical protein
MVNTSVRVVCHEEWDLNADMSQSENPDGQGIRGYLSNGQQRNPKRDIGGIWFWIED